MFITQAGAEIAGPGWFMETATPISQSEARSYYKARSMALQGATTISVTPTAEIVELARGLQYDPRLIYEYVHNYIEYVPYFGSLKGATLTYLDGSGNDFGQASLMIALLRVSGYTAQFVYGTMIIPLEQLADWLGIEADLTLAGTVVASGGIPITINPGNSTSTVDRVWVRANIGGVDYLFDPAFKSHIRIPKIDLAQAMGYVTGLSC